MSHHVSVFANSCLKMPIDPITKMPKTAYERKKKSNTGRCSTDSSSTVASISGVDIDGEKVKEFYQSIPDYKDINHLPRDEFYSTLKVLRDKKELMLGHAVKHIDDTNGNDNLVQLQCSKITSPTPQSKCRSNYSATTKTTERDVFAATTDVQKDISNSNTALTKSTILRTKPRTKIRRNASHNETDILHRENSPSLSKSKTNINIEKSIGLRPKRNHSSCSISWNDRSRSKDDVDKKFESFFDGASYKRLEHHKSRSMPTSPLRMKRSSSPSVRKRKSITVPKPFKMTERDEDERMITELRSLRKCFSDEILDRKTERRQFHARPVPIESRILLYDKILEDQAMRRAISKINSEADLRAQMKPFSFVKREERGERSGAARVAVCDRAANVLPRSTKKKRFRARPVPKNLFSNYIYDKMKDEEFYRSFNRRIRSEELMRVASLPGNMATRDRSRLSTPAAHSDLPIDPSPHAPSATPSDRQGMRSPTKDSKRNRRGSREFITTSPQPFRFNTAERAAKRMQELTKKIDEREIASGQESAGDVRAYSALELREPATGRSNLAALLRVENVRRRFETEAARRLVEQHRRAELRVRDRQLRSKPAWHLVKNNHEEDIALRLQTRRDEERMRREEFLHEMELMYGRVQQQPLLFERYYAPRSLSAPADSIQLSPRKKKSYKKTYKDYHFNTPMGSRKVSINDTAETYKGNVAEYLHKIDNEEKLFSDSEAVSDSQEGTRR